MRRLLAGLLIVSGLVVGGWTLLDTTGDDVGTVTVGQQEVTSRADDDQVAADGATGDTAATVDEGPEPPTPAATTGATPPDIGRSSGRITDLDVTPAPAPARITLPTIGVDAAVVPVGVDPDGLMGVPEDVATAGWYRWGSTPTSEGGTTVLAGHVDDRVQGRGAFFDLRALQVGDEVTITDEDGGTTTWRVTGRRTFQKASLPVDDLYQREGPRRLVLITCGGEFDRAARSYEANVVVEAEPLP